MKKSKKYQETLKAVRALKPDRFVIKIKRPSQMTHAEAANKIYWKIDEINAVQDLEVT